MNNSPACAYSVDFAVLGGTERMPFWPLGPVATVKVLPAANDEGPIVWPAEPAECKQ
jgi:hypothetical protein